MSFFEKAYGAFMGTAIGDAIGMPAYYSPQETWEKYGWIEDFLDAPEEHEVHRGNLKGQVTDDTEQAYYLALAYIENKSLTVENVAAKLVEWYQNTGGENNQFVGPSTKRAMRELLEGADPYKTGLFGETNGCVMRISPVGIVNASNIDGAIEDAVISCTPTHFTNIAISGACAIVAAISEAMSENSTIESIVEASKIGAERGRNYGRKTIAPSISAKIDLALQIANSKKRVKEKLVDFYNLTGTGLLAAEIVPTAIGIFVLAEGDPVKTVIYGANASGDADTLAAIAGSIAGAYKGIKGFKETWVETVKKANPQFDFLEVSKKLVEVAKK